MPRRAGSTSGCCSSTSRQRPQVPDVLGQRVPPRHGGVHEVGVAGVVVLGVPVEPLAEAAQVRRQHHVAPADQLRARSRRWACRCARARTTCDLPGPVAVAGEDGRPGCRVRALVGHEQVGGHRHGVLGVEDDLVPPVAVARHRLERLDVEGHRLGLGTEQLGQAGTAALDPGPERGGVVLGQRVLVDGGAQPDHPLVPGRVVPGRRGQGEGAPVSCRRGHARVRVIGSLPVSVSPAARSVYAIDGLATRCSGRAPRWRSAMGRRRPGSGRIAR